MSILDRVTKVVGDVVDRGKKEVDQFVRIQKINSQIGDLEKSILECNGQIQQSKIKIGEMTLEMLQAGTLSSPEIKALADQIVESQKQISSFNDEIGQRKAEIERVRAEGKSTDQTSPVVAEPSVAPPPPPPPPPPPAPERCCPQCGTRAGAGGFCSECGAKLP
jgi:chromosome segregation ATPase